MSFLGVTSIASTSTISSFYKIWKDIAFSIILLLGIVLIIRNNNLNRKIHIFYFILLCLIFSSVFYTTDILLLFIGIRWCMPLFLIIPFLISVDNAFMEKVTRVLFCLLIFQVISQIVELGIMPAIYGNRFPGFFIYPSGAGIFAVICFLFCYVFKYRIRIAFLLALVSLIMAKSTAGIAIFIALCGTIRGCRNSKVFVMTFFLLPLVIYAMASNLEIITGRSVTDLSVSGGTRMEIFESNMETFSMFPEKFGTATNTAVILNLNGAFIADSTYTSVLVNLGIIGLLIMLLIIAFFLIYAITKKELDIMLFLIAFTLGGISVIIWELFPINLLFPVSIAYFVKRELSGFKGINIMAYNGLR